MIKKILLTTLLFCAFLVGFAENGYRLWLRYDKIANNALLQQYRNSIQSFYCPETSPILAVARKELQTGLQGLLDKKTGASTTPGAASIVISVGQKNGGTKGIDYASLGKEGFVIRNITTNGRKQILIAANSDAGALYGVFHFLRLLQTNNDIQKVNITSIPKIQHRVLNHWDNLNRHVERGYAGISLWNWHTLPGYIDQRYIDYARANASLGINGTVLTNVNANALVLTDTYLQKVKALADVFRSYGIKVFLTARFSAPIEIGGLKTADPLNEEVQAWWKEKAAEIYKVIPDFGGFLVKANSEGQPGPQNYGRTHADGANMLADAVAPFGGIVMWRAFVYTNENPEDRVKQAYTEFKPLDGKFRKNVLVQVKNGPLDFQPREPFSPLFGAMPQTPLMMEFQITQEYLGQGTNLVYEAPMFKEVLQSDTYRQGEGSTVAKVIDGRLHDYPVTGIAGVSNIGNDINWTGHLFGQANWYAYGRLAWDHQLSATQIADEWIRQTFSSKKAVVDTIQSMMQNSYEAMVNYMTPLGLHHIMGTGHHYGPAPWIDNAGRPDWNPVYYHRADEKGIGFDRTTSGSNAVSQYAPELAKRFNNIQTCPEEYLLWFHHVPWNYTMKSGRTLWDELCLRYQKGVDEVRRMQKQWDSLRGSIDEERFRHVQMLLAVQEEEARWWRDACLQYFQTFSKQLLPEGVEKPAHSLEYYQKLKFPYAPGNG
ncbi:MAG TPA: alpha-glucuronidase family glycosyl hydrolase [Flavisolibacter sp.]|jgi:alpha-glucuronidase|nr:alpha-glucuronidase family glycosyl hydrolase [Flavisolibacter sp.]